MAGIILRPAPITEIIRKEPKKGRAYKIKRQIWHKAYKRGHNMTMFSFLCIEGYP